MDCSLPGSSVHGIFRARILEWVAIAFSRGSFWPRDRTRVSRIVGRCFTVWATRTKLNNKAQSPQLSNLHFYLLLLGSGAGPRVQQDRPLSSTAALPSLLSHSGGPTLGPRGPQLTGPPWLRRVRLCDPTDRSTPGRPSITNSRSPPKPMSVMPSTHLVLCRPLLLPPSIFPSIKIQWVSSSHQVAKGLELQLQHQSFQWIPLG